MIQEFWITKSFEGLVKAGSFIYIHLYVEKNKTRLHPDMAYEEWKAELDILKEHLDMGNPQDYIAYRNVELELLVSDE